MIKVSSRNLLEENPPRHLEFGGTSHEREGFFTMVGNVSKFLQEIASEMCDNNHSDIGIYDDDEYMYFEDQWRCIGTIKDIKKSADLLGLIADNYAKLVSCYNTDVDEDENCY